MFKNPETYEAMDTLVKKGKNLHYGLAFTIYLKHMKLLNNQILKVYKFNLIYSDKNLMKIFLKKLKKNIAIIARGPLASGLLGEIYQKILNFRKTIIEIIIFQEVIIILVKRSQV